MLQPKRTGKQPTFAKWVKHLLAFKDKRFKNHPAFMMIVANQLQRRTALTIGNVVAKSSAKDMTVRELQEKLDAGDNKVLNDLRYHSKVIPGSNQFWLMRRKEVKVCMYAFNDKLFTFLLPEYIFLYILFQ